MAAKLPHACDVVHALLSQGRRQCVKPFRPGGCHHHALGRQQQAGQTGARQYRVDGIERHFQHDDAQDRSLHGVARIQGRCHVEAALVGLRANTCVDAGLPLQSLLEVGAKSHIQARGTRPQGFVGNDDSVGIDDIRAAKTKALTDHGQSGQHGRGIGRLRAARHRLEQGLTQTHQGHGAQGYAARRLPGQRCTGALKQLLALCLVLGSTHLPDHIHDRKGCRNGNQQCEQKALEQGHTLLRGGSHQHGRKLPL